MTFNKYKRLTIVLFLPLLVVGILSVYLNPEIYTSSKVICKPSPISKVDCVSELYQEIRYEAELSRTGPDRFHVYVRDSFNLIGMRRLEIQATPISLNVRIRDYKTYNTTSAETVAELKKLIRTNAVLTLSSRKPGGFVSVASDDNHLLCSSLTIKESTSLFVSEEKFTYKAECIVGDEVSTIAFGLRDYADTSIEDLNRELTYITNKMESEDRNAWFRKYFVSLPMPLYLYFLISGIVWVLIAAEN